MTHDDAECLARKLMPLPGNGYHGNALSPIEELCAICNYILSGDYKREIENAAYRRVADLVDDAGFHAAASGNVCQGHFANCANRIRSLIPPAPLDRSAKAKEAQS